MTTDIVRAADVAGVQSDVPTAVVGMTIKVDTAPPPLIEVRNISKRFGSLQALSDVSLTLRPGTFRALLGENGAGKSTLVKCIMGTYRADSGSVRVGQSAVELKNPRQAHALGIGMVYQHFTLVENMTVVENMVMAREHVPAVINWKAETEELRRSWARCRSGSIRRPWSATCRPAKNRKSRCSNNFISSARC